MATKIRPIVFKIDEPEGFVMNGSNATYITGQYGDIYITWQSPTYSNAYNGDGKQYILVNNNVSAAGASQFMYANTALNGGPDAISSEAMRTVGTSTGTLNNNLAIMGGYGVYLQWTFGSTMTLEQVQAYMANVSITILDP